MPAELKSENIPAKSVPRKNQQYLRLAKYDGRTEVEAFLRRFETCARHNGWSDVDRLNHLMVSLSAPADQILWEYDSNTLKTWSDLVQRLRARYGSAEQASLHQTQLATRRQRPDEGLNDLVLDIRRLMTLAYPNCGLEHGEVLAVRAFLDAMRDQSLALKIREREPVSLDQAFKLALRLDSYRQAAEGVIGHDE